MLHESPWMVEIDVDHWRNMQGLLLDSAKAKRRIILIHENGEIQKFVHTQRAEIVRNVTRVDQPAQVAEEVYRANADSTDFVMVLERDSVDRYFGEIQDAWKATEDLDEYVHNMYAKLADYPEGIATYPGSPGVNLGLQWRVGASFDAVRAGVQRFVTPETTVVFGVFVEDTLWASLVLEFDADRRITVVTTADTMVLSGSGGWKAAAKELVDWAEQKYVPCSLGLFMDRTSAREFLASRDKLGTLQAIANRGKLLIDPLPAALTQVMSES
jgi:hypothetical protein